MRRDGRSSGRSAIDTALDPGRFISYNANFDFVRALEHAEEQIRRLVPTEPGRAVVLYKTFLAGCHEKAEEIDDSSGSSRPGTRGPSMRTEQRRKTGFMSGVEHLVAGLGPSDRPSFLERAKARREREAATARGKHLEGLAGRESKQWSEVDTLVATKQPKSDDQAIRLLVDLRDLDTRGKGGDFRPRIEALRQAQARRPSFIERLKKAGL
jgi:hypothetical protein